MAHAAIFLVAFAGQWLSTSLILLAINWLQARRSRQSRLFVYLYWLTLPASWAIGAILALETMLLMTSPPNFGTGDQGFLLPYAMVGFVILLANGAGGRRLLSKGRNPWFLSVLLRTYAKCARQPR